MTQTDRISGLETSQALKAPVKAATTANITLSGAQTIDGVAVTAGDRVLVKDQDTATEDGIYLVQTSTWTRAKDWNGTRDATEGTLITIKGGTVNNDTIWRSRATDDPYVIDTVEPNFGIAEFFGPVGGKMKYNFDSSTTVSEDPGDGDFRLNNATIASATVISFSDNSADSGEPDMSPFIITWDDSTNLALRGTITISEIGAPEVFAIFSVSGGVTDGTTYVDVPVAYVSGSGSFTAATGYNISFARTGDIGSPTIEFAFDTSTSMADPGTGEVRFDNGTVGSVTNLAFSNLMNGTGNPDISDFIATWDDSSNSDIRGTITLFNTTSLGEFAIFNVTGAVTDNTSWLQVPVTYVDSSGTPAASDVFSIEYSRTGDIGEGAGVRMKWDTDTTDADQGAGTVWLNNATVASATIVYMDDVEDAGGASVNSWVDSFDDSTATIQGTLTLTKQTDPAVFAIFNVTGAVTSASTYSKIASTYVTGAGSFSADDKVTVNFSRSGDNGVDGTLAGPGSSTDNSLARWDGTDGTTLKDGAVIGTDVQAFGAVLDDFNTLGAAASDGQLIVATGAGAFAYESGATVRASIGAIATVVEDTSPQSGANHDMNSFNLLFDDATGILDSAGNEHLIFQETVSAINQWEMTNQAAGSPPSLGPAGGDTDIDARWLTKGDGIHNFSGASAQSGITALTSTTNSVAIDLADNQYYSHLLTENTTLANPSNMPVSLGMEFAMFITQNSTAYTLGYGTFYEFVGTTHTAMSTAVNAQSRLDAIVQSSTSIQCVLSNGIA
jgi:hypothetical protein